MQDSCCDVTLSNAGAPNEEAHLRSDIAWGE